jgi:hypothetical protein
MATSACHGEVLGTFEGRVNVISYEKVGALVPAEIGAGDRVIGCFRYRPEDAQIEVGPDERGFWRYRFRDAPSRNVFALSIGGLVWRSGETFTISVANEQSLPGGVDLGQIDQFSFWYGRFRHELTVLPQHPGVSPGGGGTAWFNFIDHGSPPAFLKSIELPDSSEAFDFAGVDRALGSVGGYGEAGNWTVNFDPDPASVVINGRPALPGAVPPATADEAAGLCSEAEVSDASEATETR